MTEFNQPQLVVLRALFFLSQYSSDERVRAIATKPASMSDECWKDLCTKLSLPPSLEPMIKGLHGL